MDRRLRLLLVLAVMVTVGCFIDSRALLAAPIIFGIVADGDGEGEGDGDEGDGDGDADLGDADSDDAGDDDPDAGDDDPADGDGEPGGKKPARAGRQPSQMIPAYRLEQQQRRFEQRLEAESRKTQQLLSQLRTALGGAPGDQGPTLTDRERHLRSEFLKLFPEFERLLPMTAKATELLAMADEAPAMKTETDRYWERVARSTTNRLMTHTATELGVKKLDPETRDIVRDAFVSWVKADKTGERNDRYEGSDETLIGDFWTFYRARFVGSARSANAAAIRRSAPAVPRGGRGSTQMPSGSQRRRKVNPDEDPIDEVSARAWSALQDELEAGR
jgi:hypothetical protein